MRISENKQERIYEQILAYLYSVSPKPIFTAQIAREIIRDEEFTKKLLLNLKKKELVLEIKKNSFGDNYIRRIRWKLADKTYQIYKRANLVI